MQRRVFDNCKYIGCLQRSNIHLTDDPIVAVQSRSILTKSGQEYPADTIVSKLKGFEIILPIILRFLSKLTVRLHQKAARYRVLSHAV